MDAESAEISPNALLRLAISKLAHGEDGVAQRAIDAALSWSDLLIPGAVPEAVSAVVKRRETNETALAAFTHQAAVWRWTDRDELVCRVARAPSVVRLALDRDFSGLALDPSREGMGGIIIPRSVLKALAAGSALKTADAGDNLALRLAVDVVRKDEDQMAHEALLEALINGRALVPVDPRSQGAEGHEHSVLQFPKDPSTGERVLVAFSDREALSRGPSAIGRSAVVMRGPAVIDMVVKEDFSALVLNPSESGAVVLPASVLAEVVKPSTQGRRVA